MKTIEVVAAIIRKGDQVFATQRGYGPWKDFWEWPGGKIEPGETPTQALRREIMEELDADISIDKFLHTVEWELSRVPPHNALLHVLPCHRRPAPERARSRPVAHGRHPQQRQLASCRPCLDSDDCAGTLLPSPHPLRPIPSYSGPMVPGASAGTGRADRNKAVLARQSSRAGVVILMQKVWGQSSFG